MYLQYLLSTVYLLKARKTVIAAEKRRHFVLWKKETHNTNDKVFLRAPQRRALMYKN